MIERGSAWGNTNPALGLFEYRPQSEYKPKTQPGIAWGVYAPETIRKLTVDEYYTYYTTLQDNQELLLPVKVALAECLLGDLTRVYPNNPELQDDEFLYNLLKQKPILTAEELAIYQDEVNKFYDMITGANYVAGEMFQQQESEAILNQVRWDSSQQDIRYKRKLRDDEATAEALRVQAEADAVLEAEAAAQDSAWQKDIEEKFVKVQAGLG